MDNKTEAFLDIETTGLSITNNTITVIGIYLVNGDNSEVMQLVGDNITDSRLMDCLSGVETIYTYNGSRFDLPFITYHLGVDLSETFEHEDLMFLCQSKNLYGGLKKVEKCLGIKRKLTEVNGYEAVKLWWRYANNYDKCALDTLLEYNKEDVVNLYTIRNILKKS